MKLFTKIIIVTKEIIKKILKIREHNPKMTFLRVPGMIDYNERMNLYNTTKNLYQGKGNIAEFGAFFGSSAACISQGIIDGNNSEKLKKNTGAYKFHVFDVFQTPVNSQFGDFVKNIAKKSNLQDLLSSKKNIIDFEEIFNHNMAEYDLNMQVHKNLIDDLQWNYGNIEILHLDLPKDWVQAKKIAKETFPAIIKGGHILFQDFVYHWSCDLIALIGFFLSKDIIEVIRIDGTTLTTRVNKVISKEDIIELDIEMTNADNYLENFDYANKKTIKLQNLYAKQTILLAKSVFLYANNQQDRALIEVSEVLKFLRGLNKSNIHIDENFKAMEELLKYNFKMPSSWQ